MALYRPSCLATIAVFVGLVALTVAQPATFYQTSPHYTMLEVYDVVASSTGDLLMRAGTDRSDGVYPVLLSGSGGLGGSFTQVSNVDILEYDTTFGDVGHSLVSTTNGYAMALSRYPYKGGLVVTSPSGKDWTAVVQPAMTPVSIATDGKSTLAVVVSGDDGFSVQLSTDFGSTWTVLPLPFASGSPSGFDVQAAFLGDGVFALTRYGAASNATGFAYMETSDFKTFTEVVVAKLGNSTGAYATVLDVMIGPGATGDSLTAVINSEGDKTVQFYSSTDGGQSWNAKGSVAVNNPATLTKVVGSGSTVVVDHASHRWVTSDLMTFKNATVPAGQARVHADPTTVGSFVGLGDYGLVQSSTDGVTWTTHPNGPMIYQWTSLFWDPIDNVFLAHGDDVIVSSADGHTWTPAKISGIEFVSFAYSSELNGLYGVTEEMIFMATSMNATWTQQLLSGGAVDAAVGNGVWVYADRDGDEGHLYVSKGLAATTWEKTKSVHGSSIAPLVPVFSAVLFAGGHFYAFAQLTLLPRVYMSADGKDWKDIGVPTGHSCGYEGTLLGAGNNAYLHCADDNAVYVYSSGWKLAAQHPAPGLTDCSDAFVSLVDTDLYFLAIGTAAFYSTDGLAFDAGPNITSTLNQHQYPAMASHNGLYVALGEFCETAGGAFIYASTD